MVITDNLVALYIYIYIYIYIYLCLYIYINTNTELMLLFIIDYTDCVSILAVSFHMQKNPVELFKENAGIESNHLQPTLKCLGFVDGNSFPVTLEGNAFMLTIENTSIAKTKDFVTAFSLLLCSHYVFNLSYSRNLVSSMAFFQNVSSSCQMTLQYLRNLSKTRNTGLLSF